MEVKSISLGDALRKLAVNLQTDLQNSLLLMRGQDPELRTVEMRSFIARSRRKLSQFYALVRWLSTAGVSQCFRGIADFSSQMTTIDEEMARNLDEMYFVHASIYSMRSRPLEITKAMDILARKTYHNLPGAMFSCGRPEFPQALEPADVTTDLNVFLKIKVKQVDSIQQDWPVKVSIAEGMLTIEYPNYFQLFLTLKTLSEQADWTVLNCKLCSEMNESAKHKQTQTETSQDKMQLIELLRKLCAEQQAEVTHSEHAMQEVSEATSGTVLKEKKLQAMLLQCRAAALTAGLKALHRQLVGSLEMASYFKDTFSANLVTRDNTRYLSVKFWRSTFHRDFLFEAKVLQLPADSAIDAGLHLEVRTTLSYQDPTLVFASDSRVFPIPGTSDHLSGEKYLRSAEADARGLVRDVLALCADAKLDILVARLAVTMGTYSGSFHSAFSVEKTHSSIVLRCSSSSCTASLSIRVDARNGKYTIDLQKFGDIEGLGKRELELFHAEINNVDAERHVSNYLLRNGIRNCGQCGTNPFASIRIQTAAITTLEDVLKLFVLTPWGTELTKCLPEATNQPALAAVLLPACGLGKRGLVYNTKCWEDVDPQWLREQSRTEYQALYPNSLIDLSDKTLVTASLSAPAASAVKRNLAKKRGFSEAAMSSAIPGDFVSAANLAESQQPTEKARFVIAKHSKKVIAQYVMIAAGGDGMVSLLSCICRVTITASAARLEYSQPVVLHQHTFLQSGLDMASATCIEHPAMKLSSAVREASEWCLALVNRPVRCSEYGFENNPSSVDVVIHAGNSLSIVRSASPVNSAIISVTMVVLGQDVDGAKKGWKPTPSSVPGHFSTPTASAAALQSTPFASFSVWKLQPKGDVANFGCGDVKLTVPVLGGTPLQVSVFAAELVQSVFASWTFPAATSNVKLELLKRVKLCHMALHLLCFLTTPPPKAPVAVTAMEVIDVDAPPGEAPAAAHRPAFRVIHFTVEPTLSTGSASGCALNIVCTPDQTDSTGYLNITLAYTCSTMRGQGKNINVAEISSVELKDVLPGRFERQYSVEELVENDMALLNAALTEYTAMA